MTSDVMIGRLCRALDCDKRLPILSSNRLTTHYNEGNRVPTKVSQTKDQIWDTNTNKLFRLMIRRFSYANNESWVLSSEMTDRSIKHFEWCLFEIKASLTATDRLRLNTLYTMIRQSTELNSTQRQNKKFEKKWKKMQKVFTHHMTAPETTLTIVGSMGTLSSLWGYWYFEWAYDWCLSALLIRSVTTGLSQTTPNIGL